MDPKNPTVKSQQQPHEAKPLTFTIAEKLLLSAGLFALLVRNAPPNPEHTEGLIKIVDLGKRIIDSIEEP
jgi:hypothetical protein